MLVSVLKADTTISHLYDMYGNALSYRRVYFTIKSKQKMKNTFIIFAFMIGVNLLQAQSDSSSKQIESFINGTSKDINSKTLGYGMTFMHEIQHTTLGGSHKDDKTAFGKTGPVVDKMNKIRGELGSDFGQRTSYQALIISGGGTFIPFSSKAFNVMQGGISPYLTGSYIKL